MSDALHFGDWLAPLLDPLTPAARAALGRRLAQGLRRRTAQRIAAQQNPDGSPFAPRRIRARQGGIRRRVAGKMFRKLRQSGHLKAVGDADGAAVGYRGRAAHTAQVHQHGLRDRVAPGIHHRYAARRLLGFSAADREWILDELQRHWPGRA